jgi:ligand-binding SRPBCC domain-containing protein
METIRLEFTSALSATPGQAWDWIRSVDGVLAEMRPFFRMGMPRGLRNLDDQQIVPDRLLFRSPLYLFGFIPAGHSDLTFTSWEDRVGFVEQSPMTGMRQWRHERRVARSGAGCVVTDRLDFEPRFARRLVTLVIRRFFHHRHAVLRKRLGGVV